MNRILASFLFAAIGANIHATAAEGDHCILSHDTCNRYVAYFNRMETENIAQAIPNSHAADWMRSNIPYFECPQDNFEEIYYFRWWSLRKHIRQTPRGFAFTEFLVPRSYADQYNLISCALGHHIMESRWLRNPQYLNEYIHVWFRGNAGGPLPKLRRFSSWTPHSVYQKYLVDLDRSYMVDLLPDMIKEYEYWEKENLRPDGLFWQYDVRDGMEEQISGSRTEKNARPTINSYMAGNADALAKMAAIANNPSVEKQFQQSFVNQSRQVQERLWNPDRNFFETVKMDGSFAQVREQIGYLPWYFGIAKPPHDQAWRFVSDENGFLAPYGLTTAERNHPLFRTHGCCNCEWDGAVWPFATSQTLTAMANRLQTDCEHLSQTLYMKHFELYVESQYHRGRPYIGEYLDEKNGNWLKGDQERSRYYHHSTFADLLITGLIGLRPRSDDLIEVVPLVPNDRWDWFCLDGVQYHGRSLTILWDKYGTRYHRGPGLIVMIDGQEILRSPTLARVAGKIP